MGIRAPPPGGLSDIMIARPLRLPAERAGDRERPVDERVSSGGAAEGVGGRLGLVACVLASVLLFASAFPPFALFPLAWVALVPLLVALSRVGVLAGAGLGLLFCVVLGFTYTSWLPGTLAGFFDLGWPVALLTSLGVVLLCGFPYVGFGAFVAWRARRGPLGPGTVALGWGGCELLRVHGFVETPWALIAYTQVTWVQLIQSADLFGAVGLGMLIAAVNGGVAGLVTSRLRPPGFARSAVATAGVLLATLAYGSLRLADDFAEGDPIRVALVQGAVSPDRRFEREFRADNLEQHLELTRRAAGSRPQLVLWPELAVEFQPAADPALWQRVSLASRAVGAELLVGAPHARQRYLVREPVNSAFLVRDGRIVDRHDKFQLLPFSEERPAFLPMGRDRFRRGLELRPLHAQASPLGVLLCSESLHPALVQRLVASGAELLANPSNDDWFASRSAADHQLAAAVFRAVESRRFVLRPSTSGRSVAVDAHGRILALAPFGEPAVIEAVVHRSRTSTLYHRLLQSQLGPSSGLALVSVLILVRFGRRDP